MLSLGLGINKNVKIFNGILDEIGNAGNAKYIFSPYKRLISSFEGNLVKVQRSSDYTSKWFGYDGNGDLKTSELLTWVGVGNDGLVEEVANQANTDYNAIQSTLSYKPKIVSAGNLESNGILFDGSNDYMNVTKYSDINITNVPISIFVKNYNLSDNLGYILAMNGDVSIAKVQYGVYNDSTLTYVRFENSPTGFDKFNNSEINSIYVNNSANRLMKNESYNASFANYNPLPELPYFNIGARTNIDNTVHSLHYDAHIKTIIIFNSDEYNNYTALKEGT